MNSNFFEELKNAQEELKELESQYIGRTPAQQQTLDKLKLINPNYTMKKKVLDTKIEYLKAQIQESEFNSTIKKIKEDDALYEAMLDSI